MLISQAALNHAGNLGCSREPNKGDSYPLKSLDCLSEIKWRIRGACQPVGGYSTKEELWSTKEPEQSWPAGHSGALWREPWFCGKVAPAFISQSIWRSGHLSSPQLLHLWGASDVLHKFKDPPAANRRVLVCVVKVKHVDERGLDMYECWSSVLSLVCPLGQGLDW